MSFVNVGFATPAAIAIVGATVIAENASASFHVARILRTPLPSKSVGAPKSLYKGALSGVEITARIELVGGAKMQAAGLVNEVAEAVEDRRAFVDLHASEPVRSVADDHLSARINRIVRELTGEVGWLVAVIGGFVAVDRHH